MQTDAHVTSAARTAGPKRGYRYRPSRPHLTLNMTAGVIAALMLLPTAYLIPARSASALAMPLEMLAQPPRCRSSPTAPTRPAGDRAVAAAGPCPWPG
ncbi:MAG: hypothetical protein R2838_11550 [Caldilineaceae bacterium]